ISLAQAHETTISYGDLEALLLNAKCCISYHFAHVSNSSSTTLVVACGCETSCGRGSFCSFYGSICNYSRSSFPPNFGGCGCQICGRLGHTTIICYNCLNLAYEGNVPPQCLIAMAAHNVSSSVA
ncbi:unnamed protein product, partial [Prunus brigantina]